METDTDKDAETALAMEWGDEIDDGDGCRATSSLALSRGISPPTRQLWRLISAALPQKRA